MGDPPRVLIISAAFYEDIARDLLDGACEVLNEAGARFDVIEVPGALEIPAAVALADDASRRPLGAAYDGYVALGCVIRGETYHFEIVADQSAAGLMQLAISRGLCIGNGILTVENEAQAHRRSSPRDLDKGGAAARACLDLIDLKRRLTGGSL
ncbi:6,7-dimethyl-8-ribityllumazine synthase [Brevundimonas sp. 2R-24]|uniref:6,7-dimethyl-8-ribityllumazine synthase n=1 Tax=Peiella sedimenti TaxID=3061083 RepID=A0ABT8SJF3_9CAUL|nr:6,7-dimethyl-8-ribityllumazine synthase [Caulobacteraceae bacterium XZ-24]